LEYILAFFDNNYLSEVNNENEPVEEIDKEVSEPIATESDEDITADSSLLKAIEDYRKIIENNAELTEKEMDDLDKVCDAIRERKIIDKDHVHIPEELESENKILMGPPTLTRFEKARIMGARALQLSLGAPPFIDIPKNATTSLQIAMEELDHRVIPITIRRVHPNGDFQNIPLFNFK
jgi:DNA-directed RNA polymerase I, II, and III subunit RPABC2